MSATRSATWPLLVLNLCVYVTVAALAGSLLNIFVGAQASSVTEDPSTTLHLITFSLISAAVGIGSAVMGVHHMYAWSLESFSASAASASVSLILSLEALGIASKEINVGLYRNSTLKALEALTIIAGVSQLFYVIVLQLAKVKGEFS
ncbi:hypothetical protein GOP47_0007164 [Adiantum capillus-veneris]|uniref:Uncharacterized protein n=1 Tax=Adiantum capillus-veneris TaxID=13818 RepID=A0A9D4V061_ADICA|nr:hypothetical protein GOP47_0007164 [Adiantum capillus-veneris]